MYHNHLLIVVLKADEIQSSRLHNSKCKLLKFLGALKHLRWITSFVL